MVATIRPSIGDSTPASVASMNNSVGSSANKDTCSTSLPETQVVRLRVSIGGSFIQKEDGSYRYSGGETFLESVPVSWRYADLVFSLAEKVDGAISIKYQLPGEDLDPDALITIADDSDISELFDEYFRALKLPGTPIKTFRLRLFLFKAAEDPYTQEDLEAEARYLEMLPIPGSSILDSEASSTRGDDLGADGTRTPSTVADAELAWEAGFKAGQEAAMIAVDEQWSQALAHRVAELAQNATDYMSNRNSMQHQWNNEASPPPSLPAPGVPPSSPNTDGRRSPVDVGVASVQMGAAPSMDPSNDPEFEAMFESKYERVPANGSAKSAQNGNGKQSDAKSQAAKPSIDTLVSTAEKVAASRAVEMPPAMMPSPATRLPTHISIFGDDLGEDEALAAVQKFGPPPAAAANLPSHISEFGGSDDGEKPRNSEDAAEAEAVAVANAALPEEDTQHSKNRHKPKPAAAPDAALLPTAFDLLNTSGRTTPPLGAGVGEGGLPQPPLLPSIHHQNPSILASVNQVDSSQLTVLAKIGEGSFGEVSLVQCPTYGRVAVKWIKSSKQERWASFWREAELMSRLNHPNVLRFFGLVIQEDYVVGIMTEFAGNGSLTSFMRKRLRENTFASDSGGGDFLTLKQRAHLALHAVNGMAYLHDKKIVHLDIKGDNLLVDGDWSSPEGPVIKVADFGLSVVKMNTFCSGVHDLRGTLPYMAPEMITDHKHVNEAADVWSLGVVFWEMLTQQQPYADIAPAQLLGALGSGTARLPIPEWCEPEWRAVMEQCWLTDPSLRPTCRQLARQLQRIRDNAP